MPIASILTNISPIGLNELQIKLSQLETTIGLETHFNQALQEFDLEFDTI